MQHVIFVGLLFGVFALFRFESFCLFYSRARTLYFLSNFVALHGQVSVFITYIHVLACECFDYFHCMIVGPVTNHSHSVSDESDKSCTSVLLLMWRNFFFRLSTVMQHCHCVLSDYFKYAMYIPSEL